MNSPLQSIQNPQKPQTYINLVAIASATKELDLPYIAMKGVIKVKFAIAKRRLLGSFLGPRSPASEKGLAARPREHSLVTGPLLTLFEPAVTRRRRDPI